MAGEGMGSLLAVDRMLARGADRHERRRRRLMAVGAALATVLLLAAGNLLAIKGSWSTEWAGLVAERGLRKGTALALAMLVLPVLAFLYQASRIAQATQDERLAALRLAGATPRAVRTIAAIETARIGAVGAVFGCVAYMALELGILPSVVQDRPERFYLPLPMLPAAVLLVAAGGALAGLLASRQVTTSPLDITRRVPPRVPGKGGPTVLVIGWVLFLAGISGVVADVFGAGPSDAVLAGSRVLAAFGAVLILFGMWASASWFLARTARRAARRARTAESLLAARALEADPRAWGRVLGVVGMVVFIGSAAGWIEGSVLGREEKFYAVSMGLVDLALIFGAVVSAAALSVHRAESLMERRRVLAALTASGVPLRVLRRAAVRQTLLAAGPVCAVAALLGLIALAPMGYSGDDPADPYAISYALIIAWACGRAVVMALLGIGAALLVTLLSHRYLTRAASPSGLRNE